MSRTKLLPELLPRYAQLDQTGVDARNLAGNRAFKPQGIRRGGEGGTLHAVTTGVENALMGLFGSEVDLGLVAQWFHDERGEDAFDTLFEDDDAVGLRSGFNDEDDPQALVGVIRAAGSGDTVAGVEASPRVGQHVAPGLEARAFSGAWHPGPEDPSSRIPGRDSRDAFLETEGHVQLDLKWYL